MKNPAYSFRVVWSDEDEAFVAVCPEFEGVSGIGESPEEALSEAQAALGLMVETYQSENWPLPEPAALSDHSGQFRLRVPRSLHALLVQCAADDGVSLNTYAVSLLAAGMGSDRSAKHMQRHVNSILTQLRCDLYGDLYHHQERISTSASGGALAFPAPFMPDAATAGGELWRS